ncbi:MAG: hypothetical protein QM731_22630 [Chitinophagaceae bacterium]
MITTTKKSLKVGKYVSTAHVNEVISNYKKERWVHNSERIGKEDSLSAWYSVEELEEFIAKIKDHGADGIKLYFAAYSADYAERPEYAARQTLVLVGTKHNETPTGAANKDIYIQTEKGAEILAYNASNICPPSCGSRWPNTGEEDGLGDIGITIVDRGEKGLTIV